MLLCGLVLLLLVTIIYHVMQYPSKVATHVKYYHDAGQSNTSDGPVECLEWISNKQSSSEYRGDLYSLAIASNLPFRLLDVFV